MTALERPWYADAARRLVADRGPERAQRVADFHRRAPIMAASGSYADLIEAEIKAKREEAGRAAA